MPEYYIHVDPAPPIDQQLKIAERDIRNLAFTCAEIERRFGEITYELVILDDFTVYVWVRHSQFAIELYPNNLGDGNHILKMFIDSPDVEASERDCQTVTEVIESLRQIIST